MLNIGLGLAVQSVLNTPVRGDARLNATLYSQEFYDRQSAGSLASARIILGELLDVLPFKSAVDIGCGVAPWLRVAIELGAERAIGIDGDYVDRNRLLVDPSNFMPCDLEAGNLIDTLGTGARFDLAICMEVAEHLSSARASSFVSEICALSDFILFSAAIPGQGGTNHINEQWPRYWCALFNENNFACFDVLRPRLWDQEQCEWWYLQNVLIFARRDSSASAGASALARSTLASPMSLVHPRVVPHVIKYSADRIIEQLVKHQPFGRSREDELLEEKLHQLRLAAETKASEVDRLKQELELQRKVTAHVEGEIKIVKQALEQATREYLEIKASTSWRITAPLRGIARIFKA